MRTVFMGLMGLALLAACSKAPANTQTPASTAPQSAATQNAAPAQAAPAASAIAGPAVSGSFVGNGKAVTLTQVTAHPDDPFDGKPITALVFTVKDQGDDKNAATDALFGNFGDAIIVKIEPDGTVIGCDVVHSGLQNPAGSVSIGGVLTIKNYQASGGQISGELTTGGPTDVFDKKLDVDLTFHVKAP